MVFFADRRKPVNIYEEGRKTEKIQSRLFSRATAPARAAGAVANIATYPAQQIFKKIVAPPAEAAATRLTRDRDRQVNGTEASDLLYGPSPNYVAQQKSAAAPPPEISPGRMRDGIQSTRLDQATQESFKNAVASNAAATTNNTNTETVEKLLPQRAGAKPMQSGSGWIRNEEPGETVSIDGSGNIAMADAQGNKINKMTRLVTQSPNTSGNVIPQRAPGAGQRVGNMDVTFGPDVDQDVKERFLRDPVRPTAQINRYNNQQQANNSMSQGQVAATNASVILNGGRGRGEKREINTFGDVLLEKRDMALERMATQKQEAANQQQRTANELAIATDRNGIDRFRVGADVANTATRNEIDRLNVTGSNAERNATVAEKQLKIKQQEEVGKLQSAYEAAPDDKTKKEIEQKLVARGVLTREKPQIIHDKQLDANGNLISDTPYIYDNGAVRKAIPEGGGNMDFGNPTAETKSYLSNLKTTNPKEYERVRTEWKAKQQGKGAI